MAATVEYDVSLSEAEVIARFRELPEIGKRREFVLVARRLGFDLRRTRKHPPFEEYELAPLELRVSLTPGPRGTLVAARTNSRPRWGRIALALAGGVMWFGASIIAYAVSLDEIRERRLRERSELLNLVGRALAAFEHGTSEAPYRAGGILRSR